jgi:hypothetical protein
MGILRGGWACVGPAGYAAGIVQEKRGNHENFPGVAIEGIGLFRGGCFIAHG